MSDAPQRIADIQERLDKRVSAFWRASDGGERVYATELDGEEFCLVELKHSHNWPVCPSGSEADLIAHSPDDIAYLLAELASTRSAIRDSRAAEMLADRDREEANARHDRTLTELRRSEAEVSRLRSALAAATEARQKALSEMLTRLERYTPHQSGMWRQHDGAWVEFDRLPWAITCALNSSGVLAPGAESGTTATPDFGETCRAVGRVLTCDAQDVGQLVEARWKPLDRVTVVNAEGWRHVWERLGLRTPESNEGPK